MPGDNTLQFHHNFIRATKQMMADKGLATNADVAAVLQVGTVTVQKIMSMAQTPTVEQGIRLCQQGGFDANWLFLNEGEMSRQIFSIAKELADISVKIDKLTDR